MPNKIGWCDITWNPVWGCRNRKCPYCYARVFAKRFYRKTAKMEYKNYICSPSGEDDDPYDVMRWIDDLGERLRYFIPTFLDVKFNRKFPKKPQRIFVGSMSEIAHWERNWMIKVLKKIEGYPQHTFQFLTKYPEVYYKYFFPKNCWLGVTITDYGDQMNNATGEIKEPIIIKEHINYISIEPILNYVNLYYLNRYNWVIIGAETGNRKDKVIPKKRWIDDIVDYCRLNNTPTYLKDSLKNIYPTEIKEFP